MKPYYEDGAVTIYHGDCREILSSIGKVDLVLTDPPYGIGESSRRCASRGSKKIPATDYGFFDWDKSPPSKELIELTVSAGTRAILWGGNYFNLPPSRGWFVWDKQNNGYFADCELAWTNLETSVRIFRHMWNGMIRAGEERWVKRVHPTQKPIALMRWCIQKAGAVETILDPFMGSGTTLRAAKDLGCKAIGIELDERYCEIAANRMLQEVLF